MCIRDRLRVVRVSSGGESPPPWHGTSPEGASGRPAETTRSDSDKVGRVGRTTGRPAAAPAAHARARGASEDNPTGAQGVPTCPAPRHTGDAGGGAAARAHGRGTTATGQGASPLPAAAWTGHVAWRPPPPAHPTGWRGPRRRSLEEGTDPPRGPDRPDPRRTGDPQRVFKPPRRDALGTWTEGGGGRARRGAGERGQRPPPPPPRRRSSPRPAAADTAKRGARAPRRCRPVTDQGPAGAATRAPPPPDSQPPSLSPVSPPPPKATGGGAGRIPSLPRNTPGSHHLASP